MESGKQAQLLVVLLVQNEDGLLQHAQQLDVHLQRVSRSPVAYLVARRRMDDAVVLHLRHLVAVHLAGAYGLQEGHRDDGGLELGEGVAIAHEAVVDVLLVLDEHGGHLQIDHLRLLRLLLLLRLHGLNCSHGRTVSY